MKNFFLFFSVSLLLAGCMVGPNYSPPDTYLPDSYSEDREGQTCNLADEDFLRWWTLFNDPILEDLLAETVFGNYDLRIAFEKIYQARSQYWVQFSQLLPELDTQAVATRSRTSQALNTTASRFFGPPIQNFYLAGFDAIWEIDLFGKIRRTARSAYNLWESSEDDARGVQISVLSEVAVTYTNICALQLKLGLAEEIVQLDEELLHYANVRFEAGLANQQEVETAVAAFESDKAALLVVEINLKQTIYSLALLLGRHPESLIEEFEDQRAIPHAIGRVPLGLPSDLLRRRPDIRSAERQVASATEQIGIAVADLFPSFSLTGSSSSFAANPLQGANYGWTSNVLNKLFSSASRVWGLGVFMQWPLFDWGRRMAVIDVQVALEHQAFLNYQKTVISALVEVENALVAYFNEEERLKSITIQAEADRNNLELTKDLFQAGLVDYTQVIQSKEIWITAETNLADSEQALTTNLISLYKALGGDWECFYTP